MEGNIKMSAGKGRTQWYGARRCGSILAAAATAWAVMIAGESRAAQDSAGFAFRDEPGKYLDVLLNGKTAARYMYAYDPSSSPKSLTSTNNTYLHVFDAQGKAPISNGPFGEFAHHRGIMIGWTKLTNKDKVHNFWGMYNNAQIHSKFSVRDADTEHATFTSMVDWVTKSGDTVISEERTMTFHSAAAPVYLIIDFTSKLTACSGDVELNGDPEHGGVQFRAADGIDRAKTVYVYPGENVNPRQSLDPAWVGETFSLNGKMYSSVQMNHPSNPQGSKISAYRNYGRFGYFPKPTTIKSGESFVLRYRFLAAEGAMPAAGTIQQVCNAFTGRSNPVPPVTVRPADQPAPPKAKSAAKAKTSK
ncbi:MAG: DUF6807 family protein [Kiritimatiellia bacterium]